MKNNLDDLFVNLCQMLRNPDNYTYLAIETVCYSLEILHQRIIDANCKSALDDDITKREYEQFLEKIFKNLIECKLDKIVNDITNRVDTK